MTYPRPELMLLAVLAGPPCGCGGEAGPAMVFKKLDGLPLEIEVPADAKVAEASADAPAATVSAGEVSIVVATTTGAFAADFAGARKLVEGDPNKLKEITLEEEFEGGWHLEYELAGMNDQAPLYGVEVRKTIDGAGYQCGRVDRSAVNRDAVARACLTLKKAG